LETVMTSIFRLQQCSAGLAVGSKCRGEFKQSNGVAGRLRSPGCATSKVVIASAAFVLGLLCSGDWASAATWTVTSTNDGLKKGTLRYAVKNAVNGDTIFLAAGTGKPPITLNGSEIVLDKNLTITADKKKVATVSANGKSRIFRVTANVRIENVVLADGNSTNDVLTPDGGGILNGGVLSLTNVSMIRNISGNYGGAVYNAAATLTVNTCAFADNYAKRYGGGIASIGFGSLLIQGSTFTRNSADEGSGAICNVFGDFTITTSSLTQNVGLLAGGAIGIVNTIYGNQSLISNCTLSGNSSQIGGAIECFQADVAVVGSWINVNDAGQYGGGIACNNCIGAISYSNITQNTSVGGGSDVHLIGSPLVLTNNTIGNLFQQ